MTKKAAVNIDEDVENWNPPIAIWNVKWCSYLRIVCQLLKKLKEVAIRLSSFIPGYIPKRVEHVSHKN
jgi:hypothetical protein